MAVVLVLILLSIGAIVCTQLGQRPGSRVTPTPTMQGATTPTAPGATVTATPSGTDITPAPAPGVILGQQTCPTAVKDPAYWDAIIGTQSGTNKVETVSCANFMGTPSLQALVTVRSTGPDAKLDVYIYNNITSAKCQVPGRLDRSKKMCLAENWTLFALAHLWRDSKSGASPQ